jgi:hypothetical protein
MSGCSRRPRCRRAAPLSCGHRPTRSRPSCSVPRCGLSGGLGPKGECHDEHSCRPQVRKQHHGRPRRPVGRRCAIAEGIGHGGRGCRWSGNGWGDDARASALTVVGPGGLVGNVALCVIDARLLRAVLGPRVRARALTTIAVAGLGWAAASAPQTLSGGSGGAAPPVGLVLPGGGRAGPHGGCRGRKRLGAHFAGPRPSSH